VRDVAALVLLAAGASTVIAATNGVTVLWLSGNLSDSYASSWFLWWSGDAMGDLVAAPLLLVWLSAPFGSLAWPRSWRAWRFWGCSRA
jgi:integral membrane sensor domain MASE1